MLLYCPLPRAVLSCLPRQDSVTPASKPNAIVPSQLATSAPTNKPFPILSLFTAETFWLVVTHKPVATSSRPAPILSVSSSVILAYIPLANSNFQGFLVAKAAVLSSQALTIEGCIKAPTCTAQSLPAASVPTQVPFPNCKVLFKRLRLLPASVVSYLPLLSVYTPAPILKVSSPSIWPAKPLPRSNLNGLAVKATAALLVTHSANIEGLK